MTDPCPYCMRQMDGTKPHHSTYPTRDHVTPRSKGGKFMVVVCRQCNNEKANLPILGWLGLLRRRGDPRAVHVAAFIEAHPLRIRPVIAPAPANISNDNKTGNWTCNECQKPFRMHCSAIDHWLQAHPRKAS